MKLSKQEIIKALNDGHTVHWSNEAYIVTCESDKLYVTCKYNDYMTGLQPSEYI